ncbi:MAG: hypothetical protein V4604_03265 [Bacteroidota bacterium]
MSYFIHLKLVAVSLLLAAISSNTYSQGTEPNNRIVEIAISTGFANPYSAGISDETWNKYTPDFVIPADSLNFQQNSYSMYSFSEPATILATNSYVLGSVHVSYRNAFLDAKKIRSSLGIVFGSGIGYESNQNWTRTEIITIDTLTSSQTGQQYTVDSTHYQTIGRSYSANEFMFGVSHFFQTDPLRRFSLYVGVSANVGFSVNSRLYTYESNWSTVDPSLESTNQGENELDQKEIADAPKSHSVALQIPLELSFRPWKNGKTLQGLAFGITVRPTFKHFVIADQKANRASSWYGVTMRLAI